MRYITGSTPQLQSTLDFGRELKNIAFLLTTKWPALSKEAQALREIAAQIEGAAR